MIGKHFKKGNTIVVAEFYGVLTPIPKNSEVITTNSILELVVKEVYELSEMIVIETEKGRFKIYKETDYLEKWK